MIQILNKPNWLGSEIGELKKTITVTETSANYIIENDRKVIKSGTLISDPVLGYGLLFNDADITDGAKVAQMVVRGTYIDSKLPTSVSASKAILAMQGLYAIEYAETLISGGHQRELIQVGDKVSILYCNDRKSKQEIKEMLDNLGWQTDQYTTEKIILCSFSGNTEYSNLTVTKSYRGSAAYDVTITNDAGVSKISLLTTGSIYAWDDVAARFVGPPITVEAVYLQDKWKDFISKEPFIEKPIKIPSETTITINEKVTFPSVNGNFSINMGAKTVWSEMPYVSGIKFTYGTTIAYRGGSYPTSTSNEFNVYWNNVWGYEEARTITTTSDHTITSNTEKEWWLSNTNLVEQDGQLVASPMPQRPLIEVGDEISTLYFNSSKSNEQIVQMIESLDTSNSIPAGPTGSYQINLITFENGSSLYAMKLTVPGSVAAYQISYTNQKDSAHLWASNMSSETRKSLKIVNSRVTGIQQQDMWADFISKLPFDGDEDNISTFEVGSTYSKCYFNQFKTATEAVKMVSGLDYSAAENVGGGYYKLHLVKFTDGTSLYIQKGNTGGYSVIFAEENLAYIYASGHEVDNYSPANVSTPVTVQEIYQQEDWKDFISPQPFEDNSYLNDPSLINAGDYLDTVYFNTGKSNNEVEELLSNLDWSKAGTTGDAYRTLELIVFKSGGSTYSLYARRYSSGTYEIINSMPPTKIWTSQDGWFEGASEGLSLNVQVEYAEHQQDIWKDFISKEPFETGGGGSKNTIPNGTIIKFNDKVDVQSTFKQGDDVHVSFMCDYSLNNVYNYIKLNFSQIGPVLGIYYDNRSYPSEALDYDAVYVPENQYGFDSGWKNEGYRTITITEDYTFEDGVSQGYSYTAEQLKQWFLDNSDLTEDKLK